MLVSFKKLVNFFMAPIDNQTIKDAKIILNHCQRALRQPLVYQTLGIVGAKDNLAGRMNLLAIFVSLAMGKIPSPDLRQAITNQLVYEIDDGLRQDGVSDMVVGRRVKQMVGQLYARLGRYYLVFYRPNFNAANHAPNLTALLGKSFQWQQVQTKPAKKQPAKKQPAKKQQSQPTVNNDLTELLPFYFGASITTHRHYQPLLHYLNQLPQQTYADFKKNGFQPIAN